MKSFYDSPLSAFIRTDSLKSMRSEGIRGTVPSGINDLLIFQKEFAIEQPHYPRL